MSGADSASNERQIAVSFSVKSGALVLQQVLRSTPRSFCCKLARFSLGSREIREVTFHTNSITSGHPFVYQRPWPAVIYAVIKTKDPSKG